MRGIAGRHDHVMKALLEKRGDDIQITPEMVVAAAGNWESGEGVMKILLEKPGGDIKITPEVVVAAAENGGSGEGVMKILLEERGGDIQMRLEWKKILRGNYAEDVLEEKKKSFWELFDMDWANYCITSSERQHSVPNWNRCARQRKMQGTETDAARQYSIFW